MSNRRRRGMATKKTPEQLEKAKALNVDKEVKKPVNEEQIAVEGLIRWFYDSEDSEDELNEYEQELYDTTNDFIVKAIGLKAKLAKRTKLAKMKAKHEAMLAEMEELKAELGI